MTGPGHYRCPICKPIQALQLTNGYHECASNPEDHRFVLTTRGDVKGYVLEKRAADEFFPAVLMTD